MRSPSEIQRDRANEIQRDPELNELDEIRRPLGDDRFPTEEIRVGYHKGEVIVKFSEAFVVNLHPNSAKALAKMLLKYANPVTR